MREGWHKASIGEVGTVVTGTTPATSSKSFYGGDIPFVAPGDLGKGLWVRSAEKTLTEAGLRAAKPLPKGTVLFTCIGATIGKAGIADRELATNQQINAVICDPAKADNLFVYYLLALRAESIKHRAGTQAVPIVNKSTFEDVTAPFPPLKEQRQIAATLRTWDEAIEKLEALRATKRFQLTGWTQQFLGVGGVFPSKWQQRPLSALSTRVRRQNGGGDHPVMTISAKSGFRLQSDKFSRDMAGSSVDRYILLHAGEFAYNKGNSLTAPYGCIFALDRPTALVPFVYFCFALNAGLNHEFFAHLFSAGALNHQLSRLINSGVRNDGLLNLDVDDFFGCKVPVPPIEEQCKIGRFLTEAKTELDILDREIAALTRQKRGLMQKLLTGEWRVKADGGEGVAA